MPKSPKICENLGLKQAQNTIHPPKNGQNGRFWPKSEKMKTRKITVNAYLSPSIDRKYGIHSYFGSLGSIRLDLERFYDFSIFQILGGAQPMDNLGIYTPHLQIADFGKSINPKICN